MCFREVVSLVQGCSGVGVPLCEYNVQGLSLHWRFPILLFQRAIHIGQRVKHVLRGRGREGMVRKKATERGRGEKQTPLIRYPQTHAMTVSICGTNLFEFQESTTMPVMSDTVSSCLFHCFVLSLAFVTTQHNAALFTIQWMDSS